MRTPPIESMAMDFAANALHLSEEWERDGHTYAARQLAKHGTQAGRLVYDCRYGNAVPKERASQYAQAEKDAEAVGYWLELMRASGAMNDATYRTMTKKTDDLTLALILSRYGQPVTRELYQTAAWREETEIPQSAVVEITKDTLVYRDGAGNNKCVSLSECAQRYLAERIAERGTEYVAKSDMERIAACGGETNPAATKTNCIGERLLGKNGYYEIWLEPHLIIACGRKKSGFERFAYKYFGWFFHSSDFSRAYETERAFRAMGWGTLDLS